MRFTDRRITIIVDDAFIEKFNNPVVITSKNDDFDQQEKEGIAALKRKLNRMSIENDLRR